MISTTRWNRTGACMTYDFSIVVVVHVRLHVPYDLMSEKLGELCRLDDVPLCISERVVAESLHDLRDIEEGDIHRMALQSPHSVLEHEWVVPVLRKEERHSRNGVDRSPVQEMLPKLAAEQAFQRDTVHTLSWKLTSSGSEPPRRIGKASGCATALAGKLRSNQRTSLWILGY